MNIPETRVLLDLIAAVDRRVTADDAVPVWAAVLQDVAVADAVEAVPSVLRDFPDKIIQPGHILAAAERIRHRRENMQRAEDMVNQARQGTGTVSVLRTSCRLAGCVCTHDAPCEAGWVEIDDPHDKRSNAKVIACPNCRPAVRAVQETATDRQQFQDMIRNMDAREAAHKQAAPPPPPGTTPGWD